MNYTMVLSSYFLMLHLLNEACVMVFVRLGNKMTELMKENLKRIDPSQPACMRGLPQVVAASGTCSSPFIGAPFSMGITQKTITPVHSSSPVSVSFLPSFAAVLWGIPQPEYGKFSGRSLAGASTRLYGLNDRLSTSMALTASTRVRLL